MCRLKTEEKIKKGFFNLKATLGAEQGKNEVLNCHAANHNRSEHCL